MRMTKPGKILYNYIITVSLLTSYLVKVGLKKTVKALQHDCNAELLEDIINVLLSTSEDEVSFTPIDWLRAIADFDRFSLNVRFFDRDLLQRVSRYLMDMNELEVEVKFTIFE